MVTEKGGWARELKYPQNQKNDRAENCEKNWCTLIEQHFFGLAKALVIIP